MGVSSSSEEYDKILMLNFMPNPEVGDEDVGMAQISWNAIKNNTSSAFIAMKRDASGHLHLPTTCLEWFHARSVISRHVSGEVFNFVIVVIKKRYFRWTCLQKWLR